ncbi:response regulator [Flavilitoribacter nigricans]|uniref:Response regulator n=1 Tax=Flavilitoribacter nigricans (strain ATCC 23147 / DSM 23189 / NBRC 102662 / NCIMB 1420 / SS-2) TaxID=1122177 RepID=A0A2D0NEC1_FLAN2|nr:response regulator [Flavilitoribacter nigricans]PHN06123.1 response regulator [Flavilitoribacter nigricans DSM 23189 = NBRC 102662]
MKNTNIQKVLLVDDNPADNYFHNIILSEEEFAEDIITHESTLEALEYLQKLGQKQPDIIFLDINMPRLDGWQFLKRYETLFPRIADRSIIFMLTTSINREDEKKADKTGMVAGFFKKPLEPKDLGAIKVKINNPSQLGALAE